MEFDRHTDPRFDGWRLCRGPANWFTFLCPDLIEVRQTQTVIELRMKDAAVEGSPRAEIGIAAPPSIGTESATCAVHRDMVGRHRSRSAASKFA